MSWKRRPDRAASARQLCCATLPLRRGEARRTRIRQASAAIGAHVASAEGQAFFIPAR
jgi:hypothetical protein